MKKHLMALVKLAAFVAVVVLIAYFTGNMHVLNTWYAIILDHVRHGMAAVQDAIAHLK